VIAKSSETGFASLLEEVLAEQQQLTAVERFSRMHDATDLIPAQSKYYRSLMPATNPGEDQQYAFDVDLDACSGCKSCVAACHSLNGLDDTETWREVGMLHGGTTELPVLQHVTSACHHCLEPACMDACPVDAYEKDPLTGIVKHLDDQCFGCQYCTLACPYDVPKYNKEKGIVRKCDMCSSRLAVGEAPACVQSCPNEAIRITIVDKPQVIEDSETNLFLPGAPEPSITLPTTVYKSSRVLRRNMLPADYYKVKPEHAHWPLVLMLVLTQLSVGAFLVEYVMTKMLGNELLQSITPLHSISALAFGLIALAASTCHLGRPQYAFRAVIGLRHSWLSREIIAFGVFAALSTLYAGSIWMTSGVLADWIAGSVVFAGAVGVLCSIMIYQRTQRAFWSASSTTLKFVLSTLLLGIATVWGTLTVVAIGGGSEAAREILSKHGEMLCQCLMTAMIAKLIVEHSVLIHLRAKQHTPLKQTATLLMGELAAATWIRLACGVFGGLLLPSLMLSGNSPELTSTGDTTTMCIVVPLLFVSCLLGEIIERYLFFSAVVAPKMPGRLTP